MTAWEDHPFTKGSLLAICAICLALQREEERYQYLMENKLGQRILANNIQNKPDEV